MAKMRVAITLFVCSRALQRRAITILAEKILNNVLANLRRGFSTCFASGFSYIVWGIMLKAQKGMKLFERQREFNKVISKTRCLIECTLGSIIRRWVYGRAMSLPRFRATAYTECTKSYGTQSQTYAKNCFYFKAKKIIETLSDLLV